VYLPIGSFARLYAGATPSTSKREYWENGTISWMSSGEVNLGQVYKTEKYITQAGYDNSSTKMLPKNTVVVALAGLGAGFMMMQKSKKETSATSETVSEDKENGDNL
jgi:hypothetical protein